MIYSLKLACIEALTTLAPGPVSCRGTAHHARASLVARRGFRNSDRTDTGLSSQKAVWDQCPSGRQFGRSIPQMDPSACTRSNLPELDYRTTESLRN